MREEGECGFEEQSPSSDGLKPVSAVDVEADRRAVGAVGWRVSVFIRRSQESTYKNSE